MKTKITPLERLAIADLDYKHVKVNLLGHDGNAIALVGTVRRALKKAGAPLVVREVFKEEALSGTYDELLATIFRWVDVVGHCPNCDGDEDCDE